MKRMSATLPFLLIALLFACSKSSNTNPQPPPSTTPGPLFTAVKSVMQTQCAVSGCHASPNPQSGINLADDNTIVAQKTRIKVRAVDNAGTASQMPTPPRAALSAADRKKITDWIDAGGRITD